MCFVEGLRTASVVIIVFFHEYPRVGPVSLLVLDRTSCLYLCVELKM